LHGLDAVSFAVVAPLAGAAGVLSLRGRPLGALLGFAPAAYAFYMAPQYVLGPDWRDPDSNRGHHDFQAREPTHRTAAEIPANEPFVARRAERG
jgi:hypothetical protein